ncbi:uv-damaged DNA-binding protein [Pochonia chlamydosporia 170]|uniref:Uv-damaged DNA-binding protein n=1 Tax=Pochonia chlamydosporia 170 TaxID=1380566 RepID=A0A179FTD0_METCM|nr:uv-damaged DNA-binding protein [Pochonia chlamydosporia 170]OAQ68862.1 uv-damaged DNA-binding protein [Pochonia chlamydosporia 170]
MAIYSAVPPPEDLTNNPTQLQSPSTPVTNGAIDIDAWTISALQSLSVSPVARGTGTPLSIPLDDAATVIQKETRVVAFRESSDDNGLPRRPPSRRDSMKRRDELLKGKEGSRQRRRWENDHLVGVPNVQPPVAADWEVHPTHPVQRVPYQLAQFWDRGVRQRVEEKTAKLQAVRKKQQLKTGSATGLGVGEVPRDLREMAKRTPAIRGWVHAIEEPVRQFLFEEQDRRSESAQRQYTGDEISNQSDLDSDDEEIVFVGRDSAMRELREKKEARCRRAKKAASRERIDSGVVFDSFGEGESAAFKRWLAHSISDYYGLASKSVTPSNTSCRVVYVGLKQVHQLNGMLLRKMPRPLWEMC